MLALLASMLKRIITAISSPFRMIIVRLQRVFNINVISAKLVQPLTKNVKKLMTLRPSEESDYIKVGKFLVFKQLLALIILAACAGVFIYFSLFAKKVETAPVSLTGIKTDVSFRYDDMEIKNFSGIANILSYDGGVVYTGEIAGGVCKGAGFLYARDGSLVYEGSFDNNKYNGYGVKYSPDGYVEYEGEFIDNLYHGAGKQYNAKGGLVYGGSFASGQYEGEGKLYDENGGLIYEGTFSSGKSHGTGTQYYPGGVLRYRGEFFSGLFQGRGELYDKSGRLLYTGVMHEGKINYRALAGATLADIEAAFSETPGIFYQEDGNSCFFYEKAGVVITTDCRVKVYEWEREKEDPSGGFYFMPEETVPWPDEEVGDVPWFTDDEDASEPPLGDDLWQNEVDSDAPMPADEETARAVPTSFALAPASGLSLTQISLSDAETFDVGEESASSSQNSNAGGLPDFVDKTKALYFEIDRDVWQPEQELDKTKVFIKRVTVLGGPHPPETGATPIDDNGQPGVEDCVMIDYIRRQSPTAFADISFEMDKQNKLFQRIWNINYANRVARQTFIVDDATYSFCYQPENAASPAYYSIETQ